MKPRTDLLLFAAALLAIPVSPLRAQVVNDGATNTLSNVTNTFTGDVTVGTNGSFTLLILSDNALLTNSGTGFIGVNPTARSNEVQLVSPTARWQMGIHLYLGSNAPFNRLVVSNGATLRNGGAGFIGLNGSASNNLAIITGSGSTWSNASVLYLGFLGAGNQLVVSNGAVLANEVQAYVGVSSSNNLAVVTGSGSMWASASELGVGLGDAGNQLLVSNGGTVRTGHGYVGVNATASDNLALITGTGSVWSNALDLEIGSFSANNNQMIVSNGATVFAAGNGLIGSTTNANGNSVTLTDPGTLWSVGNNLYVGSNGANASLVVNNGALLQNNNGFVGNGVSSSTNRVVVTGAGSSWRNSQLLVIGENGGGNNFEVSNGGFVGDSDAAIGDISSGNQALISGGNSIWSNRFDLTVGYLRGGNQMVISNGAFVRSGSGYVGRSTAGTNCQALVTGAGSEWTNDTDFYVGVGGTDNRVTIENGGRLTDGTAIIGANFSATNDEVLVTGAGSIWSNRLDLILSQSGNGNRVVVTNGGLVICANGRIGQNAIAVRNDAFVTGLGSMWSNRSDLYVGDFGSSNRLMVSNGGAVFTSSNGVIGFNNGANSNSASVTDPGSKWLVASDLYVGSNGAANLLIVSNGGFVQNGNGFNGFLGYASSSSNNLAVVTGSGSLWSNSLGTLFVGRAGSGNQLVVSNAGLVDTSVVLLSGFADSSNNLALITGPGSLLRMLYGGIYVGDIGVGNRMVVSNGGSVVNFKSIIGTATFSSNNEALVTGAGSTWTNQSLEIGCFGSGNRLIITNGGLVSATISVTVGQYPSSTNNRVVVDGGTLSALHFGDFGLLDVRRGTNVLNAGLIEVDKLLLTNALGIFEFNSGLLITRGALITNLSPFVVGIAGSTPAVWDVRAGPSNHVLTVPLSLGQSSSFNQLRVTNGALLSSVGGVIGLNSNAKSNTAVVAGPSSTWSNSFVLEIGVAGSFNSLVVSNGGFVRNTFGYLGQSGGNNLALVTGSSSVWTNANDLTVDNSSNQLTVSDGGLVANNYASVGSSVFSSNNLVVVTGTNSVWNSVNDLSLGGTGAGNRLIVTNGGLVRDASAGLGGNSSGSNNVAVVTGSGSVWSNATLTVGGSGRGNQLLVNSGGVVQGGTTFVGFDTFGSNNLVLVTDSGSALNNPGGGLYVGFNGTRNQLVVSNGAVAQGDYGAVGFNASGSNNQALVTGSGSVWSNAVELSVGLFGRGNQLVVSNGATVAAGDGFIGKETNANRNATIVTDPGTRWLLVSNLYVGSNGAFSQLIITNGARLENGFAGIGNGNFSSNNEVVITGIGSIWSNRSSLYVGGSGSGNRLVVTNGARVDSLVGQIGVNNSSSNNEAAVTGAGSFWTIPSTLFVGNLGNGNRLVVSDGGQVESFAAHIGLSISSSNNEALVTGAGSIWSSPAILDVGESGSGNRLVVTNGAVVSTDGMIVGHDPSSTNNRVVVDSGTLRVTDVLGMGVLDVRRGTNVLNAGLIDVDQLLLTNTQGKFEFNGGTLSVKSSRVTVGNPLRIGNGVSPATWFLAGNGTHDFSGTLGLLVSSNATFTGNGTLIGQLLVQNGGKLAPGASVGKIVLSNSPSLQGAVIMEISKNGATLTNDQIQVHGPLTYGGSLTVSNLAPAALAIGDRFPLFSATSYVGAFSAVSLPSPPAGLNWTNKLLVDGSIEVVAGPRFTSVTLSGINLISAGTGGTPNAPYAVLTATNLATPFSNWVSIVTNHFDSGGTFSFTNAIAPAELARFFRIRTP